MLNIGPADTFWIEPLAETPNVFRLGLTEAYLVTLPGGLVGIELPTTGARIRAGDVFGFVHSGERTHDLRTATGFEIVAVNAAALADPRLITASPTLRGWLLQIRA